MILSLVLWMIQPMLRLGWAWRRSTSFFIFFGFTSREETLPTARNAFQKVSNLDSLSSEVLKLCGMLSFLDWNWSDAQTAFLKAIQADPQNL